MEPPEQVVDVTPPGSAGAQDRAGAWATSLGIPRAAVELYLASDVVDLHIDSFIWHRLFGYDLARRHGHGLLRGCFYSHCDVPRAREALSGAMWIVTTNPLRTRRGRRTALLANLARLRGELLRAGGVEVVRDLRGYRAARAAGRHAALFGIQGGNALELSIDDFDLPELADLSLVTLMHFTRSRIAAPALPWYLRFGSQRLSTFGADYVRKLNDKRILVDLAHLSEPAFWDVLKVHDPSQPITISHAACQAVHGHFRNVTDAMIRAIADRGGVIGVIFNTAFLGGSLLRGKAERVVDHVAHMVKLVGADHVSLGSDFDGAIVPPRDLRSVYELPRLVALMLERGLRDDDIRKVLGTSYLRVLGALRG